jgi:hypothetical protein
VVEKLNIWLLLAAVAADQEPRQAVAALGVCWQEQPQSQQALSRWWLATAALVASIQLQLQGPPAAIARLMQLLLPAVVAAHVQQRQREQPAETADLAVAVLSRVPPLQV